MAERKCELQAVHPGMWAPMCTLCGLCLAIRSTKPLLWAPFRGTRQLQVERRDIVRAAHVNRIPALTDGWPPRAALPVSAQGNRRGQTSLHEARHAVAVRAHCVLKAHAVKDVEERGRDEVGVECSKLFQCEEDRGGLSREVTGRRLSEMTFEVLENASDVITDAIEDYSGKVW